MLLLAAIFPLPVLQKTFCLQFFSTQTFSVLCPSVGPQDTKEILSLKEKTVVGGALQIFFCQFFPRRLNHPPFSFFFLITPCHRIGLSYPTNFGWDISLLFAAWFCPLYLCRALGTFLFAPFCSPPPRAVPRGVISLLFLSIFCCKGSVSDMPFFLFGFLFPLSPLSLCLNGNKEFPCTSHSCAFRLPFCPKNS